MLYLYYIHIYIHIWLDITCHVFWVSETSSQEGCNFTEVLQWYQGWKALFPPELREQLVVQRHLAHGLEVPGDVWPNHGLPSGKHTKNYGKSQFLMGKSNINGHFQ